MSFPNLNVGEILAQFTPKQRAYVLIFVLLMICASIIVTALVMNHCDVIEENNKVLTRDITTLKKDMSLIKVEYADCIKTNQEVMETNLTIIRKVNELQLGYMNSRRSTASEESLMLKEMRNSMPVDVGKKPVDTEANLMDRNEVIMMEILDLAKKNIKL
jgi:hypothetical protein